MITIEIVKVTVEVRVMLTRTIILILIIYMKKKITRVRLAENECIFHVTRVLIRNSARCQNFVLLDFL